LALGRHGDRADQRRAVDCLLELAPWTPDGNVFVSDLNTGLWVFQPTF
jgi:hypothetical protein